VVEYGVVESLERSTKHLGVLKMEIKKARTAMLSTAGGGDKVYSQVGLQDTLLLNKHSLCGLLFMYVIRACIHMHTR